jgi:hypothetical protein
MIFKIIPINNRKPVTSQYYFSYCATDWHDGSFSDKLSIVYNQLVRYNLIPKSILISLLDMDRSHDIDYHPFWKIFLYEDGEWRYRFNVIPLRKKE